MAQLKDLIVNGASRFIGDIYANKAQLTTLEAPTSAGGTTYGPGSNGQVLKSNGSTLYWASDNNSDVNVTQNAVDNTYTNWRPIIFGNSNSATEGFTPATTTGQVYTTQSLQFQPSTGTLRATIFKGSLSGNATTATRANITSRDNAIVRFNGTNGTFQSSDCSINDSGNLVIQENNASRYKRIFLQQSTLVQSASDLHDTTQWSTTAGCIEYDSGNSTNISSGMLSFLEFSPKSTATTTNSGYYERYRLPTVTTGRTTNGTYDILTTKSAVTVAQGGTGATTAKTAKENLNINDTNQDFKINNYQGAKQHWGITAVVQNNSANNKTAPVGDRTALIVSDNGLFLYNATQASSIWSFDAPSGTTNRLAYFSDANKVTSGSIESDGSYITAPSGNIFAGTFTANTAGTAQRSIGARSGAGSISIWSDPAVTGSKGLWVTTSAGTGAHGLQFNQSNQIIAIAPFVTNLIPATTNTQYLGTSSAYWKGANIHGDGNISWNNLCSPSLTDVAPTVGTSALRGLPRILAARGDAYRNTNVLFGIKQSSMTFEYTTDGGTNWTPKDISIVNAFNETTMSLTPGFNAAGTGFRVADVNSTADEAGVISDHKYVANYWTNKGVRITIDCYNEGRVGRIDLFVFRFAFGGSNNKCHYKIERKNYNDDINADWTTVYESASAVHNTSDKYNFIYPNPTFYLSGTSTSTSSDYARYLRITFIVDQQPTANRYAPRIISIAGYGNNGSVRTANAGTGSEFARAMVTWGQPYILEDRNNGNLGFDSDLLPRQRTTEGSAIVTTNIHNIGLSNRKWANVYATTIHGALDGNANSASSLKNAGRLANANITHVADGGMTHFLATSTMTSNKPASDGHILHFHWDTVDAWDSQVYIPDSNGASMQWRGVTTKDTWPTAWNTLIDTKNYYSYVPVLDQRGTALTANQNINNLITPGTYYSENSARTNTVTGSPGTGAGYKMYVQKNYSDSYRTQVTLSQGTNPNFVIRQTSNASTTAGATTWSKWHKTVMLPASNADATATATWAAVGSSSQPVYVNADGIVTAITGAIANNTTGNATTATRANITTTTNALAYYTNTTGTFGDSAITINTSSKHIKGFINGGQKSGTTLGTGATAEGYSTTASGQYSHAEGDSTKASGGDSHAEGYGTTASGAGSHAEGYNTKASGTDSHAEGSTTIASEMFSHAEGFGTTASGAESHAEGSDTEASGSCAHAEGEYTTASGYNSHAEGSYTTASGYYSHAEGRATIASGDNSHAESGSELEDPHAFYTATETISGAANATTYTVSAVGNYLVPGRILSYSDRTAVILSVSGTTITTDQTLSSSALSNAEFEYLQQTIASGSSSHAEGDGAVSSGYASHAEGYETAASNAEAHAEGYNTTASGAQSHAEGDSTVASGDASHAEGDSTVASGNYSHAEGRGTEASDGSSHAEGYGTTASGYGSHVEGGNTEASGSYSHAEGYETLATGVSSHAEGNRDSANDQLADITISGTANATTYTLSAKKSYIVIGRWLKVGSTTAKIVSVSAAGTTITTHRTLSMSALSNASFYYQRQTCASGNYSHAEGRGTEASGGSSHAEGYGTKASGGSSHAEGYYTIASGNRSHAEGSGTEASGDYSHAEGENTTASGYSSHAEGYSTTASGYSSHAEGYGTTASGSRSHAEGHYTEASGDYSHAEGYQTTAQRKSQHVFGEYNVLDTSGTTTTHGDYIEIVGNGTANNARSNARTLDWSGNETIAGKLTAKGLQLFQTFTAITSGRGDLGSGTSPRYLPYKWYASLGHDPADGEMIVIKTPSAGNAAGVWLSINGNTDAKYYPIAINGTSFMTTHYASGVILMLVYQSSMSATVYALAGADATASVTGIWRVINYYDSGNTNTIMRTYAHNTNKEFPLLAGSTTTNTTPLSHTSSYASAYGAIAATAANRPTINLSTGAMTVPGGITANLTGNASTATRINGNLAQATSNIERNIWVSSTSAADGIPNYVSNVTVNASTGTLTAGNLIAGNGDTTAERAIIVNSGAGGMYMFSQASTTGARGIYLWPHGTDTAGHDVFVVDTNNNVTYHGYLDGWAANASYATAAGQSGTTTLSASSWSSSTNTQGFYTYTLTLSGLWVNLSTNDDIHITLDVSSTTTSSTYNSIAINYARINMAYISATNKITFCAQNKPTANIPIRYEVIHK